MEGVLVRAKGEGKTISVTVVTDHEGRYSFPASRLAPGKYKIDIRAVGYDLASPVSVEVAAGATRRADLKLVKTKDLDSSAHQLRVAAQRSGNRGAEEPAISLRRLPLSRADRAEHVR